MKRTLPYTLLDPTFQVPNWVDNCIFTKDSFQYSDLRSVKIVDFLHQNFRFVFQIGSSLRSSRVRQVLADLALTQVANRSVDQLTPSEYRRLVIGVQLIKDPCECYMIDGSVVNWKVDI